MKNVALILIALMTLNAQALTNAEFEAKARHAVELSLDAAIVEGNGWHQQIFSGLKDAAAIVEQDQEDASVTWVYLQGGELCQISVKLATDFGYTIAPVDYSCPEF